MLWTAAGVGLWKILPFLAFATGHPIGSRTTFTATALGCTLAAVAVHELGHVAAYRMLGLRWRRLTIWWTLSVHADGRARTYAQQALISACGPAAELAVGATLLARGLNWSPVSITAALITANAATGLMIPLGTNTDAAKLYRSLWALARGRGSAPFR